MHQHQHISMQMWILSYICPPHRKRLSSVELAKRYRSRKEALSHLNSSSVHISSQTYDLSMDKVVMDNSLFGKSQSSRTKHQCGQKLALKGKGESTELMMASKWKNKLLKRLKVVEAQNYHDEVKYPPYQMLHLCPN